MPGKTNTDRILHLEAEAVRHSVAIRWLEETYNKETTALREDLRRTTDALAIANERIAALEKGATYLEKHANDTDQRRWQMILAILTCLFTGFVALIIALVKK